MLFWAEIYHQAKSLPSFILRPLFLAINGAVYAAQIGLWIYMGLAPKDRLIHPSCLPASALCTKLVVQDRLEPVISVLRSRLCDDPPFQPARSLCMAVLAVTLFLSQPVNCRMAALPVTAPFC